MKSELNIIPKQNLDFEKVRYYTLKFNDEDKDEIDKFFESYGQTHSRSVYFIKMWIAEIGEKYGALQRYFRPEDNVSALPPPTKEIRYLDIDLDKKNMQLRLYCIVLSEEVVILVNGGIKDSQATSGSKSCWDQYMLTSNIASQINKFLRLGYLKVKGKDILTFKSFKLTYKK